VGCEARKIPAEGDVFFLDFYLYRTYRELTAWPERIIDYPAALTAAVLRDMIINCYGVRGRSPFPAVLDPRRETKGSLFGGRYCSLKKRPHFLLDCEGESSFPLFSSSS
jgi:hypothetical protein